MRGKSKGKTVFAQQRDFLFCLAQTNDLRPAAKSVLRGKAQPDLADMGLRQTI